MAKSKLDKLESAIHKNTVDAADIAAGLSEALANLQAKTAFLSSPSMLDTEIGQLRVVQAGLAQLTGAG